MTELAELVTLVGSNHCFCDCGTQTADYEKLYAYLSDTERPLDAEAAACLGLEEGSVRYRKVKHQFKVELLNSVSSIQTRGRSKQKRRRDYAYVWKLIAIGKQLRTNRESTALMEFLREAHERACEHHMLDAAFQSATMLRRQYNNRRFDPERYRHYRDRARHYARLTRDYEDVVADLNEISFLRNSRRPAGEIAERASTYFLRHRDLIERHDVAMISYIVYLLESNAKLAVGDYRGVIEVANRALGYLAGRDDVQPTMQQVFEANLTVAYTQLNDYDNGMAFSRRLLEKTTSKEHNYLKVYELMLVLSLRSGRFQEAYTIYREIPPKRLTTDIRSYFQETFRILEAYLYLLYRMDQITIDPEDRRFARFRIRRFLNSFQFAPQEKDHRNVHLLIIRILDNLVNRRATDTALSIEAVGKYAGRHLRGKGYERARYFLKAIAQLAAQGFHRAAVERHTGRYIRSLDKYSIHETGHDVLLELIPYDQLWGLVLEQLGTKRLRVRNTAR